MLLKNASNFYITIVYLLEFFFSVIFVLIVWCFHLWILINIKIKNLRGDGDIKNIFFLPYLTSNQVHLNDYCSGLRNCDLYLQCYYYLTLHCCYCALSNWDLLGLFFQGHHDPPCNKESRHRAMQIHHLNCLMKK